MRSFSDAALDPGMRIIWTISAAILLVVWWINRRPARDAISLPPNPALPIPLGTDPPKGRGRAFVTLLGGLSFFAGGMFVNANSMLKYHHQSVLGWILLGVFFAQWIVLGDMKNNGVRRILEPLRRAEYDRAIAEADRLLRWLPSASAFLGMRAMTLRAAGRLDEAEQAYRQAVAASQPRGPTVRALNLVGLGRVWLDQGKFNDAQAVFEAAKQIDPSYGESYCGLAEVNLREGYRPQEALELLDESLRLKEKDVRIPTRYRRLVSDVWASRANVLARLGRLSEAEASLDKAAELVDPTTIPDMAGTLWRCGEALRQMGRENEAENQFKQAEEIDPNGLYGKRSAASLRELATKS